MGGGTYIRNQPANFPRESNPASRLVKILLKEYVQYKRLYTKDKKEKAHKLKPHSLKAISRKNSQCNQQRRPRGVAKRGTRALKQSQLRAQENHSTANKGDREGAKTGKTHTLKQKKKIQSQENHSTANKGDPGRHTRTTLRKTEIIYRFSQG